MFSVEFTHTAERQFDKLPKDIQDRVLSVLERIKINPYHFIKRKEGTPYFIARIGEYRAVLLIDNNQLKISVMEVGHRKNTHN